MGLLDRFKPQPRWKHADPVVRVSGVQELPEEEQDLLATIARSDPDARVRRAAVSRLLIVAALGDVARHEADAQVRDEAAGVLLDIALGAYSASEEASLAAVDALTHLPGPDALKPLVLVAKTARAEAVSRRALAQLGGDQRALGSTARRSEHASVRMDALAQLTDPHEITAVALKADCKDVALAAVERLTEAGSLRAIAARAKNTVAQRRARVMLRAMEDAEAARAAADARQLAAAEARRAAQRDVCREIEALVSPASWHEASVRLTELEARWAVVGDDVDPDLSRRYGEATAAAREALARHEAERLEQQRLAETRAQQAAERLDLCARADALPPAEVADALPALREAWQALPPMAGGDDPALAIRFETALRRAEARAREADMLQQTLQQLDSLAADLEALVAGSSESPITPDARSRWKHLHEQWRDATAALPEGQVVAPEVLERWTQAEAQWTLREAAAREARQKEQEGTLAGAVRAAEALERLASIPEATLKTMDRTLRDARSCLERLATLPPSTERDEVRQRLERAQEAILPRAQELRHADEWQRWANAGVQEQLIAKMEALATVDDPAAAARQMRELQVEWKNVASGPREQGQALWHRFKTAQDAVRARTDAWFHEQAQHRTEHLQRKLELCEKAEALADSTDWIATAEAIKALQAEWKTVGPGPRREEQAAWERFRTACDRFFTRRHADLVERKQAWSQNLARKEALCARAEELAQSAEWDAAAAELRRLQAEWKTIGPVRKNKSEAIWARFRTACDLFFERYKGRHAGDVVTRVHDREALVHEAEALAAPPAEGAEGEPVDVLARLRDLRGRWTHAPGLPRDAAATLQQRFEAALVSVIRSHPDALRGTEFDVPANLRKLHDLVGRAEKLAGGGAEAAAAPVSPATLLAQQLREALAANTIGGRADDDARGRASEQELRQLQSAWTHVGFVPESDARPLASRFQRACQRVFDQREGRRRQMAGRT
jgi:hypothetical protein